MRWKWAIFSEDQRYRYHLTRQWSLEPDTSYEAYVSLGEGRQHALPVAKHCVGWILCNPSTADATADDPTIGKLTKYSKAWGYDGLWVCNLWARRSTDWRNLVTYHANRQDINGPDNDASLAGMMAHCDVVVWAWGNVATRIPTYRDRVNIVKALATALPDLQLKYLMRTKRNAPSHPLYLPDATPPKRIRHTN